MAEDATRIQAGPLLQTYGIVSLQQMGRQRGVDIKNKGKAALVTLLARTLYDPERIRHALADLAPLERQVLDRILLAGGEITTGIVRAGFEEEGLVDTPPRTAYGYEPHVEGSVTNKDSRRLPDIIGRLGVLGLVFSRRAGRSREAVEFRNPGGVLFIPEAIRQHLPALTFRAEIAPPPGREEPGSPGDILRDTYALVSLARSEPFQLTKQSLLTKRDLVRLDASVRRREDARTIRLETDLGYIPFLRALGQEVELVESFGIHLRPGPSSAAFFARPRGERRQRLFQAYRGTERWSELNRLNGVSITPKNAINSPFVAEARQRVLAEVAELPPGEWISVVHLVHRLRVRAYELLLSRRALYEYYAYFPQFDARAAAYRDNIMGLQFSGPEYSTPTWDMVEGGFIRTVVVEPLHWLGVVDLGLPAWDPRSGETEPGPDAFRITPEGAELLQGRAPDLPAPEARVVIQPNFQVLAFEPADEGTLFALDRVARRVRAEQVTEYQLTRDSIYTAQREGLETGEIVSLLERLSDTPLPQNVRRTLQDWGAQHERIVIRRHVAAIQSLDEATLDRLASDPGFGRMMGARPAPTLALLSSVEAVNSLTTGLLAREAGDGLPVPAVSEGDDGFVRPVITIDEDGAIDFRDRLPSMYAIRNVRQVAEEDEGGALHLAASPLRRLAREIGPEPETTEVILRRLREMNGGALPYVVEEKVRVWARDWGRGALVETVLLQVERPEIMAELLADRELTRVLHPVESAPNLATVQREHVERVRAALEERGMELEPRLLGR
jgi:hypothetical protein